MDLKNNKYYKQALKYIAENDLCALENGKHIIDGDISHKWTASMLQLHPHAIVVCDEPACDELTVGTYKYYLDKERGNL